MQDGVEVNDQVPPGVPVARLSAILLDVECNVFPQKRRIVLASGMELRSGVSVTHG